MPNKPSQYFPGLPFNTDPRVANILRDLWDRVNYLIQRAEMDKDMVVEAAKVDAPKNRVTIQAVPDTQTQGPALVSFGPNNPIAPASTTVTAHTITLAPITGGGTPGSITWNASGVITGFVDPT